MGRLHQYIYLSITAIQCSEVRINYCFLEKVILQKVCPKTHLINHGQEVLHEKESHMARIHRSSHLYLHCLSSLLQGK